MHGALVPVGVVAGETQIVGTWSISHEVTRETHQARGGLMHRCSIAQGVAVAVDQRMMIATVGFHLRIVL